MQARELNMNDRNIANYEGIANQKNLAFNSIISNKADTYFDYNFPI
jgi:hypothetical protein